VSALFEHHHWTNETIVILCAQRQINVSPIS